MEILETIVEPIIEEDGWRINLGVKICIGIGIFLIAAFLVCVMLFFLSRIDGNDLGMLGFGLVIIIFFLAICCGVIGTDTYPANKLIEEYDIIDYNNGIWTITEKGE